MSHKKPSSPALRIPCPVCRAPAGEYCTKAVEMLRRTHTLQQQQQTIAHLKRRQEEERTR